MAADNTLPVWTIRPNWAQGVTETLEWLTDVLPSTSGEEQRRSMRLSPRRSFSMTFNPTDNARSYFDLFLHRMATQEFMLPLFHDCAKLSAAVAIGASVLPFDNTNREFCVGGMALVLGDDPFTFQAVTITAMTAGGITVSPVITAAWARGSTVYPLRRVLFNDQTAFAAITSRVGEAEIVFDVNAANDLADNGAWTGLAYGGYPVITVEPDRKEKIDVTYARFAETMDEGTGLRYVADDAGRAFTIQKYNWLLQGRAQHASFRQLLYRLAGRMNPVWLPSFNDDMFLARPVAPTDTNVSVGMIGYAYTGGVKSGRDHILIGGTTPAAISTVAAPLAPAEERLGLSGPVGATFARGVSAAFMDVCRLEQDRIEIKHYTDTNGASECGVSFHAFKDDRTAADPVDYPIPAAAMSIETCGAPEAGNSCAHAVVFEGWWLKVRVDFWRGDPNGPTEFPANFLNMDTDGDGLPDSGIFLANGSGGCGPGSITYTVTPHGVQGLEYTFFRTCWPTDFTGLARNWQLRLQFPPFSVPFHDPPISYATLSARRWTEDTYTVIPCIGGGTVLGDGSFDIEGLWPRDYSFHF